MRTFNEGNDLRIDLSQRVSCSPGLRAKLSIRLFQARKAIFLTVGEGLRKPNSSRWSRELMKGPPLCSS